MLKTMNKRIKMRVGNEGHGIENDNREIEGWHGGGELGLLEIFWMTY